MTAELWQPGDHISGRSIWFGRPFAAWPFVVVEDRGDVLAVCIPTGGVWKRPPDLGEPRGKDEDELDEAGAYGSMTAAEAAEVRAEAERAIAWVRRGDHPAIDDRWRTWRPPPEWGMPTLAPDWETLSPASP